MSIRKVPERAALTLPTPGHESAFVSNLLQVFQQYGYAINSLIDRESSGTWTPALELGGASTGITYGVQEGAYYRLGDLVYLFAILTLTSKGSATGTAMLGGLPLAVADSLAGTAVEGICNVSFASAMASLTSSIGAQINDDATISLTDWGATGTTVLDNTNFTNTSSLRIQGLYVTDAD